MTAPALPDLVRVRLNVVLSPDLILNIDRELREHEQFQVQIGSWLVEAGGGSLIVRPHDSPINAMPLVKVPV